MSKETEPIRSRRQLREQSAHEAGTAGVPIVPATPAPAIPEAPPSVAPGRPVPQAAAGTEAEHAPATPQPEVVPPASQSVPRGERESQTRARDRAARRAYQELVDPQVATPLPSRRAMRQAQLDAERAPITALNTVIPIPPKLPVQPGSEVTGPGPLPAPAEQPGATPPGRLPAIDSVLPGESAGAPALPENPATPAAPIRSGRRVAAAVSLESQQLEQVAAAMAADKAPAPQQGHAAPAVIAGLSGAEEPAPETAPRAVVPPAAAGRRGGVPGGMPAAFTRPGTPGAPAPAPAPAPGPTPAGAPGAAGLPVSPAANYPPLPGLVPGGSYYPVTAGPPTAPPTEEELAALAAKKAEAERAAILSQRAQARERLAQESAKSKRASSDPKSTDNLAMVTPLEFIEVPGSERPVLRPPSTTHVPIVTRANPRQSTHLPRPAGPAPATGTLPVVPSGNAERFDAALSAGAARRPGTGSRPLTGGRSSTLMQAQAMATGGHPKVRPAVEHAEVQRSQMPPMPADYAHGLEPLDAMTAGLGRTQRNMLIQWGSILVGGAALVVGAIMFFSSI